MTMFLLNRDPEGGESGHPLDEATTFQICEDDGQAVLQANVSIYVNGAAAVLSGAAQSGWSRTFTAVSTGILGVELEPSSGGWASEGVYTIRVVASTTNNSLDESYTWTAEDQTAPTVVSLQATALDTIRVTFDDVILEAGATTIANYSLARKLAPSVEATITAATKIGDSVYDLTTDIPLSHDMPYDLTIDNVMNANYIALNDVTTEFDGYCPNIPDDREFGLWDMIPQMNRDEDTSEDLAKWIGCLQEVTDLLLFDVDAWSDIIDPDNAPEQYVDAMLVDMGNPFNFAASLDLIDKRRLTKLLIPIYQQKGTEVGITNVVRLFMGIDITFTYGKSATALELGISELGGSGVGDVVGDWELGTSDQSLLYSFWVDVAEILTSAQRTQLTRIVEYMKPAHTHFLGINEPTIPETFDHLELGESELGTEWILH